MSCELENRTAVIVALRCGRTPKEIIEFFHFPKSTVYDIAKTFKESGEEFVIRQRKTQDQSDVRKRDKEFLEQLQLTMADTKLFQKDPRIQRIESLMKSYPDFPKPGIIFRDLFPVLQDPAAFSDLTDLFVEQIIAKCPQVDAIVGLESRGFLLGAVVAQKLKLGFIPVRKAGKLPGETYSVSFELEYGKDSFEIQKSALCPGQKIAIIDDLLATGGTMNAACKLMNLAQVEVLGCFVLVELVELQGQNKLSAPFTTLLQY